MVELDVLIIGAGAAGEYAASYLAGQERRVGLVEKDKVGGSCVFSACIPTKALVHAARTYKRMRQADFFGLPVPENTPDYTQVKGFKDRIIASIGNGRDEGMSKRGVQVLKGAARFISSHEVDVGGERIKAEKFIIATGSLPAVPPIPGLEEAGYITNYGALALESVPRRLAVIGGGPVGLEFAQVFSAFGAKVRIYEVAERIAAMEDRDISQALSALLAKQGVKITTGVKISEVSRSGSAKAIVTEDSSGNKESSEFDEILLATGRKPVMDGLGLEAAGVETHKKGIKVDASQRTSVSHIWAAGDITGPPYFTYTANEEGKIAALNAADEGARKLSYDILPRATFCDPEIGSVGLTEEQAVEQGFKVKTGRFNYGDLTRTIVSNDKEGFIKVVVEEGTGRILGGHILGVEASTLIHEISAAMAGKLTAAEVGDLLHSYPTFSEGVRYACQAVR